MFSDSRAPAAREHRTFKPHAPHFIPWLRNSLKSQQSSDMGLNGPYKSNPELHDNLAPLERTKGIGIFSIPGKNKPKKSDLRCNGVGMARMLPVVLRGHHILGKQKEGSPAKSKQSSEVELDPISHDNLSDAPTSVSPVSKYSPLAGSPLVPAPALLIDGPDAKVGVCMEERRADVWDYTSHVIHQRDLQSSVWLSSNPQGSTKDGQRSFKSSFSYISRNCQSQRDLSVLREPPVEGSSAPLNGVIFSTEVPHRGLGFTTTLRGPGKHGKRLQALGPNQARWLRHKPKSEEESPRKGTDCSRKVIRNQLKRVVDNLEQVLTALRDVQQEMKEVVHQIDYLTSCIDLDEEEQQAAGDESCSSSGSNEVTVISGHPRPSVSIDHRGATFTLRRDHPSGRRTPPVELPCQLSTELTRTLRFGNSPRRGGLLTFNNPDSSTQSHPTSSPQRSLPIRPPTPGLSPLTVNLQAPGSPRSPPSSPIMISPISPVSPKCHPTAVLSPSVIIEPPRSDHPASVRFCPSATSRHPSASCPPTDSETAVHADREKRASSAGPPLAGAAKQTTGQGRKGRKPPPYPHHRLSDPAKTTQDPRKAPPYPEKRRLLSTTV
ncbi:uncharacterized protein LOC130918914 [Corythoichthys intestinalis]|uniref:uncharacterized protein LOC130918914 n=1 Tax=Corythoichthys intestinalis TaxID=161448 RepID=UPI0025A55BA8|nr:uncharacterized protein LOC130918914 [Corythoichthys intestinalis]XP_057697135.1 uncharacterized protein LOC130918914 [Corythoichthys intestinalis]XP_057697137.1 uncharacterized protein LOC130918914 [Corythoichthys intestinalis]